MGLDIRGLRFARDVRRQLVDIAGPDGSALSDRAAASQPSSNGVIYELDPWISA